MSILIKKETAIDYHPIKEINEIAFGGTSEYILVENLRKNARFVPDLSLVAHVDEKAVGHILFFPVDVVDQETGKISEILSLAPLSVLPRVQNRGIGAAMINEGLKIARELGYGACVVLGNPKYYGKFGFSSYSNYKIIPPTPDWESAYSIIELKAGFLSTVKGKVVYPDAFNDL